MSHPLCFETVINAPEVLSTPALQYRGPLPMASPADVGRTDAEASLCTLQGVLLRACGGRSWPADNQLVDKTLRFNVAVLCTQPLAAGSPGAVHCDQVPPSGELCQDTR
jgi:hypothetical protein